MWTTPDIDDLQLLEPVRPVDGYAINIRSSLMADDLKPFVVAPSSPARSWYPDTGAVEIPLAPHDPARPGKLDFSRMSSAKPVFAETVFLVFPSLAAARASSLGQWWAA
jgi:hypothetical protein